MKRRNAFLLFLLLLLFTLPVNGASLSKKKLTLYVGNTYKLKALDFSGTVTWKSSNKKMATVSKSGKVTAKEAGTVTITARSGKQKKTCKVTVKPVKLNKTKLTVEAGKTFKLKLYCGASSGITWKSSAKSVVKVMRASGSKVTLTAQKAGKAKITATYKKKKYKCTVKVVVPTSAPAEPTVAPTQMPTPTVTSSPTPTMTPMPTATMTPTPLPTSTPIPMEGPGENELPEIPI